MSFSKCGHNRSILVIFLELNGWVTEQEHWTLIMASWTQWNPASQSRVNIHFITYVSLINYFRLRLELKVSQCLSFSIRSISGLYISSLLAYYVRQTEPWGKFLSKNCPKSLFFLLPPSAFERLSTHGLSRTAADPRRWGKHQIQTFIFFVHHDVKINKAETYLCREC